MTFTVEKSLNSISMIITRAAANAQTRPTQRGEAVFSPPDRHDGESTRTCFWPDGPVGLFRSLKVLITDLSPSRTMWFLSFEGVAAPVWPPGEFIRPHGSSADPY